MALDGSKTTSALLIVNPCATRVDDARIRLVEERLRRYLAVTTVRTERPGHAIELAASGQGFDAIVAYSGDGVFNEVINGVGATQVPLAFIPGGKTNVLPRALGFPRDAVQAAVAVGRALQSGTYRGITVGVVNGRRFAFAASLGFDAEIVRRIDQIRTRRGRTPNDLRFTAEAFRILLRHRAWIDPSARIDGIGHGALVLLAKARPYSYAGPIPLPVAPEADFDRGISVVSMRTVRPWHLPRMLRAIFFGVSKTDGLFLLSDDRESLTIRCDVPLALQLDGEDMGDVMSAHCRTDPHRLRVAAIDRLG